MEYTVTLLPGGDLHPVYRQAQHGGRYPGVGLPPGAPVRVAAGTAVLVEFHVPGEPSDLDTWWVGTTVSDFEFVGPGADQRTELANELVVAIPGQANPAKICEWTLGSLWVLPELPALDTYEGYVKLGVELDRGTWSPPRPAAEPAARPAADVDPDDVAAAVAARWRGGPLSGLVEMGPAERATVLFGVGGLHPSIPFEEERGALVAACVAVYAVASSGWAAVLAAPGFVADWFGSGRAVLAVGDPPPERRRVWEWATGTRVAVADGEDVAALAEVVLGLWDEGAGLAFADAVTAARGVLARP